MRHVNRIHASIIRHKKVTARDYTRRSITDSRTCRNPTRSVRVAVLAFRKWIDRNHASRHDAAALLGILPRTLDRWQRRWDQSKLRSTPRGRPIIQATVPHRNDVIHLLDSLGPHVSVATLELFFPLMSRRELRCLLKRFRRVWRKKNRLALHQLQWNYPGSVWAIDYTEPPAPIDGTYPAILVVRDLASGKSLLALPTPDQTAKTACDALLPLFRQFSAPLVLKSDNGSFRADDMMRFLKQWEVCPLLSPPKTPRYNGAVEAGIGSIKTRAHHIAAAHGRPGEWTCDDVEAARLLANSGSRPRGKGSLSPNAQWKRRDLCTPPNRTRFLRTVQLFRTRLDSKKHLAESPSTEPSARPARDPALLQRVAIRRALVACHVLTIFKPRRITPPIKPQKVDIFS